MDCFIQGSVDDCFVTTLKRKGLGRWCVSTQKQQGRYFGPTRRAFYGSIPGDEAKKKTDAKSVDLILVGSGILGLAMLANAAGVFGRREHGPVPGDDKGAFEDSVLLRDHVDDHVDNHVNDQDPQGISMEHTARHDEEEEEEKADTQDQGKEQQEEKDGVTILDSHQILGSIESVLTKSADTMLQEDADNVSNRDTTQEEEEKRAEEERSEGKKDSQAAVHDATATMSAITAAMADTAGESVASSIIGMSREAVPATEPDEKKGTSETDTTTKAETFSTILSDTDNISASQLLQMASMYEEEGKVMWESFPARHRQAEADAKTLTLLLKETKDAYDRELQQLHLKAKKFKATLENLEHMQHELLEAQAAKLHIDHQKNITRERVKRQEVLDSARIQLDSLSVALSRQSERAKKSQEAHKMSNAVFHIRDALEHGRDFSASVEYLKSLDDTVANIVLQNIVTDRPIKTRHVLLSEFEKRVKRPAMELSYIPQGEGGGMMTSLVAKIANALKIEDQEDTVPSLLGTIEQGDILEAADQFSKLVEGTVAAHAIRDWLQDVKTSCGAAQALKILDARAACLSSPYHNH